MTGCRWVDIKSVTRYEDRTDYEDRINTVKIFYKATIKDLEGARPYKLTDGKFISYSSGKDIAIACDVQSKSSGKPIFSN